MKIKNRELNKILFLLKNNKIKKNIGISLSEPQYDFEELYAVISNFLNKNYSQGKNVAKFEKIFARYTNTKYAIAVNSGSSANLISLLALKKIFKLKKNDEVIVPASTFATVAMPVLQVGLKPVFCDIDINTLNISISDLEKSISNRTKIIMPVHTLGLPCEMNNIMNIAKKKKLIVLEDCCEAHGASINKKKVGSWGDVSAFSFFIAHNITTIEGGMILTNNKKIYEECISLREFGRINQKTIKKNRYFSNSKIKDYDKRYVFTNLGYNMRMTELQGALGVIQTKKLDKLNKIRINNAKLLKKLIKKHLSNYLFTTSYKDNYKNTFYTFPLILKETCPKNRKEICNFLESIKIQTRPMMAGCLPDQPAFYDQPCRIVGKLNNSRLIRDKCFFVGIHPQISKENLHFLVKSLKSFLNE